ncbi:unnamed protein product [Brassica napus]|nr:unnamed protein product [Brassica napus]
MTNSPVKVVSAEGIQSGSAPGSSKVLAPSTLGISILTTPVSEQVTTPTNGEESSAGEAPAAESTKVEAEVTTKRPSTSKSLAVKNYANLLKDSAQLEELGTPTEHISGVLFVLILDANIAAAKEESREFVYARFYSEFPAMGRIIGVVNAIWAKAGPRVFVHNIGEGAYLLRVTKAKSRESILARTFGELDDLFDSTRPFGELDGVFGVIGSLLMLRVIGSSLTPPKHFNKEPTSIILLPSSKGPQVFP